MPCQLIVGHSDESDQNDAINDMIPVHTSTSLNVIPLFNEWKSFSMASLRSMFSASDASMSQLDVRQKHPSLPSMTSVQEEVHLLLLTIA